MRQTIINVSRHIEFDLKNEMYQQYRRKKSWLKRGKGQAQAEERYKKARAARWQAMSHIRQAYGI